MNSEHEPLMHFWLAICHLHSAMHLPNIKDMSEPWKIKFGYSYVLYLSNEDVTIWDEYGFKVKLLAMHAHVFNSWLPIIVASPKEATMLGVASVTLEDVTDALYAKADSITKGQSDEQDPVQTGR